MKTKKLLSILLAICILCCSLVTAFAADENTDAELPFAGTRTVELKIDASDLDNFVNGGRFAFETALRKNAPEWLTFTSVTKGRDYYLTLSFDFGTFDDYKTYLAFAVSYDPPVLLDNSSSLVLVEGFSSIELINFLQLTLDGASSTETEFSLKDLFTISANKIVLNGETYEQGERITIVPDDMQPVKVDSLVVSTIGENDGSFTRKITATFNDDAGSDIASLKDKFEAVGETSSQTRGRFTDVTVNFEAATQTELITKTIAALSVTNSISEQKQVAEKKKIKVFRTEFFDIEPLKRSDDFKFSCSYKIPDYYEKTEPGDTAIMEGKTITNDRDTTSITYEQPFAFTGVSVKTDISKIYSKITRTIDFTAPTYLAETFHAKTKKTLEDKLSKGVTLDIYDDNGIRHYAFTYSSWFMKDIEAFTSDVAGFSCEIESSPSILPAQKATFSESLSVQNPINSKMPFNEASCSYTFSKLSKLYCSSDDVLQRSATSLSFARVNGSFAPSFEYLRFDVVKTVIIAIILIVLIILLVVLIKTIKKLKNKIKNRPKKEAKPKPVKEVVKTAIPTPPTAGKPAPTTPATSEAVNPAPTITPPTPPKVEVPPVKDTPVIVMQQSFCPVCGTENDVNSRFCKKCGHTL